jgi:hypothetical protein
MKNILIAGGSGFIGKKLAAFLESKGHKVKILSRSTKNSQFVQWSPGEGTIDEKAVAETQVLINLCGAGIGDKRWSKDRKKDLLSSRVETTKVLFNLRASFTKLEQYISASGINAYGNDDGSVLHSETDPFGNDYVSQLVKKWEEAADIFEVLVPVTKLRIAVVLGDGGGALKKIVPPIKYYIGSALGTGKQQMSWVHSVDLVSQFEHVISNELSGVFNTNAGNVSNQQLTESIAKSLKRPLWFPKVPAFMLKLLFGEMSRLILEGSAADNSKLKASGFQFKYEHLDEAIESLKL